MMTESIMQVDARSTVKNANWGEGLYICAMLKSTLIRAVEAGAAVMQKYFQGEFTISNKEGVNNLVTEADHASERAIFEVIRQDFPDHYLLSEEAGGITMDSSFKLIIY